MHHLACANTAACHPSLLWFGLAYVFFFLLYLLDMTFFDTRPQVLRDKDGLTKFGSNAMADGFHDVKVHGYVSRAV